MKMKFKVFFNERIELVDIFLIYFHTVGVVGARQRAEKRGASAAHRVEDIQRLVKVVPVIAGEDGQLEEALRKGGIRLARVF